jgi:xenotropic and polytropic retrovirus receptor 1
MSLDLIFRFNWIFYAIYQEQIQTFSKMNFGIAISEVLRRWIWAVFRTENEHCANITQSRAHNEVVLPYISQKSEHESNGNAAHAETARETLNDAEVLGGDQEAAVSRLLHQHQQHPGLQTDLENQDAHRVAGAVDTDRKNGPEQPKPLRRSSRRSTLSRMGTIIARAHTEDFEGKRGGGGGLVAGEEEDEESSEDEDDGPGGGYASSEEEYGDDGDG